MHPHLTRSISSSWPDYFTRGQPRHVSTSHALNVLYALWIGAFGLKLVGASWDMAWHVRFLREDLSPPHLVNSFGMGICLALLVYQSWTGREVEQIGLHIVQAGVALFVLAIPLDLLNHRIFGLDVTAWSPTHFLLYAGTGVMLVGVLRSWLKIAPSGTYRTAYSLGLWAFLLEAILFPLGQQEYGTLALAAYRSGHSTASPDLLALGGQNVARFALGGLSPWLYPVWLILGSTLLLLAARTMHNTRWMATGVAGIYLLYRAIAYVLLTAAQFPPSFIPAMLLCAAIVIDLQARRKWRPLVTSVVLLVTWYAGAALCASITLMPAFPWEAAPVIGMLLWGIFAYRQAGWRMPTRRAGMSG